MYVLSIQTVLIVVLTIQSIRGTKFREILTFHEKRTKMHNIAMHRVMQKREGRITKPQSSIYVRDMQCYQLELESPPTSFTNYEVGNTESRPLTTLLKVALRAVALFFFSNEQPPSSLKKHNFQTFFKLPASPLAVFYTADLKLP